MEDHHPICRMCTMVPICNGLLTTAVNSYVPTAPSDAVIKKESQLKDGDPHKPFASEDVDLSTWVVPETTEACAWTDVSTEVKQHLKYDINTFAPLHYMRGSPDRETPPPAPTKVPKSKACSKALALLESIGLQFHVNFDLITAQQFTDIKQRLYSDYKATGNECNQLCPFILAGGICHHDKCDFKYKKQCSSFPSCSVTDCSRAHFPVFCGCKWQKASQEHLSQVPHAMVRESLNEAHVIAWKIFLLDRCGD